MSVVDELILKYSLVDDFSGKAKKVEASAEGVKKALADAKSATSDIGAQISSGFKGALTTITALGAGIVGIGTYAVKSFLEFDKLNRMVRGLSDSADEAAHRMGLIQQLAEKTNFEKSQLGEAGEQILAFGLNFDRVLPLAAEFGTAMGDNTEKMAEFIQLLGRVKAGDFGRAFGPEGFGRFGMTRQAFEQEGLKFDKNGSFLGSAEQALNGVESLFHKRFDKLFDEMSSGPTAKITNLFDRFNDALIKVGGSIAERLLPFVTRADDALKDIASSGDLERIVNSFLDLFGIDTDDFDDAIKGIKDSLSNLPSVISQFKPLVTILKEVAEHARFFFYLWVGAKVASFLSGVYDAVKAYKALAAMITAARDAQIGLDAAQAAGGATGIGRSVVASLPQAGLIGLILAGTYGVGKVIADLMNKKTTETEKKAYEAISKPVPMWNEMAKRIKARKDEIAARDAKQKEAAEKLKEIATNTSKIAQTTKSSLDLQKFVGGGGDLADKALTPIDMYNYRHRPSQGAHTVNLVVPNTTGFEMYIGSMMREMFAQMAREGYVLVRR